MKKIVLKELLMLKKMSVFLVLVLLLSVMFPYTSMAGENNPDSSNSGRTISGTITLPEDFVAAFNSSHTDIGNLFFWINAIYTNSQNVYGISDFMWQTEFNEKLDVKYSYSYTVPEEFDGDDITIGAVLGSYYYEGPGSGHSEYFSGYYTGNAFVSDKSDAKPITKNGSITDMNFTLPLTLIKGKVILPTGQKAGADGVDVVVGGEVFTIPQGENSAEYATVGWKRAGGESSFLGCNTLSGNFVYNGSDQEVNGSGNVLTGPDFVLEKGMKISGSVSLPAGAKAVENGARIIVNIMNPNNYKIYSENVVINEGENSMDYSVTVPANKPGGGYLVYYTAYYGADGYLEEGYYNTKGTVPVEKSATLVDASIKDASGIRLTLIQDNIAIPTRSTVFVNGIKVAFEAYNIEGNNYFKLRDLAKAISGTQKQFDISWDGAANAISLTTDKPYTSVGGELTVSSSPSNKAATATSSKIYLNGKEVLFTAYNIGGNNYFKLRDVAAAINFGVTWDGKTNAIGIDTSTGYVLP